MQNPILPAIEILPKAAHRATVLWLHGLGADGHDFEPVVGELQLPEHLGVAFVLPHAPYRPVTINGGYVMRAWYDIMNQDIHKEPDTAGIEASRSALAQLIEREIARGIAPERIILAGFSQGGVIALDTGARYQQSIGGVIALSTYVAFPEELPMARQPMPVFLGHGTDDPIVSHALGERSRALLKDKGYVVEWHSYPVPHSVSWEEVMDIRDWLLRRLGDE